MIKYKITKKLAQILIKILKIVRPNAGTSLPGHFMTRMYPDYLRQEVKKIKNDIVCVTGTNGKTTTSGLIASILSETGKEVLHNKKGANMPQGIATSFLQSGKKDFEYGVFECDEAWLYSIFKSIKANYLLVTNLFPDQTERYGGVYSLAKRIKKAIDSNPDLKVVLNADDPHLLSLKTNNTVLFGVKEVQNNITEYEETSPEICTCGEAYTYKKRFYAHMGIFECKNCKNEYEPPKYLAEIVLNEENTEIKVETEGKETTFNTKLAGVFNAYNVLSAIAVCMEIGISSETIQKGLDNYQNIFGRADKLIIKNKKVIVHLIKNPVGTNQTINLVKGIKKSKMFISMNDTPADGSDISWLYDTDFENLKDYQNEIIISGTRANELALRLKHAGLKEENFYIEPNIKKAYRHAIRATNENETLLILANFTALAQIQSIMKK